MDPLEYFDQLHQAVASIDLDELAAATRVLVAAYQRGSTIYVIGNGQSAATASAFALDLSKAPISIPGQRRVRIIALTDNVPAITAWANDTGYEKVFSEQLDGLYQEGDVLVAISASGNSPNILEACRQVIGQGGTVIGLAGFGGGTLKEIAQACVVVQSYDYGHVETAHVAVNHYWVEYFRELNRR